MLRGLILAAALTASSIALAAEPKSAADALAQKFSGAPDTATESKSAPAAKAPAKAVKTAEPEKKAVVAAEQAVPDRPSLDYEMDMLRRARAERAEQQKPSTPLTNAPAAMPAPASAPATAPASTGKIVVTPPAAPASPASSAVATTTAPAAAAASSTAPSTTAASSAPTTSRLVTPSAPVVPPAKVVEAAPQVAAPAPPTTIGAGSAPAVSSAVAPSTPAAAPAKLVEATPKAATPAPAVQAKADAPVADPKTTASAAAPAMPAAKASVLLAIETGGASSKSGNAQDFDPIICLADTCFVSNGLSGDAITLGKADALKLKSTKDASQAACQGMAGCVFRNVGIPSGAQIQVVDLGAPSTEPGRTYDAQLDKTCATAENELACENPIASPDFRIWIVPEEAAKTAGTEAIEDAVADGLPHRDIARDTDK